MKKNILLVGILAVMASCGRYSKVMDLPKKEEFKENTRVYGEYGAPAHQSKNTYAAAPDAAEKSIKIKEILFGTAVANSKETTQNEAAKQASGLETATDSTKK